jgi:hypothetical protein
MSEELWYRSALSERWEYHGKSARVMCSQRHLRRGMLYLYLLDSYEEAEAQGHTVVYMILRLLILLPVLRRSVMEQSRRAWMRMMSRHPRKVFVCVVV